MSLPDGGAGLLSVRQLEVDFVTDSGVAHVLDPRIRRGRSAGDG